MILKLTSEWQFAVDLLPKIAKSQSWEHQSLVLSGMTKLVMQ
ncbi:hypothetical protein EC3006_2940 [Escherichia coli 3006]|nr:hypothetical protein EC3006_2940 [Escherichia coli 3006]KEN63316.1 hypothetical protein AD22_2491 [Escherichia coli 6-537-08_S4_C2]